ncbi:MAG: 16S rRNA (adenine(1518)-N(6)/adenine(1519)-N(6))-dimethyltransferase RsmA [Coriobacteriia bacterium]|nr:16S rRNA (adenine(1518)-N(6)/adenine(1519)-N(6))-dimethyltransferase RsmA [Coriobacteriia bacterium]
MGSPLGHDHDLGLADIAHVPVSWLARPSATIELLERHGLHTKKRLGQHFLVDENVVVRILQVAALTADDVVVEVGPGIGTLTVALCEAAGAVVAVERDMTLDPALKETTSPYRQFALVSADATKVATADLERPFGSPTALVANLPYQVAATVILRFFEEIPTLRHATVMVQAEVADRIAATPGSKDWGSYSVKLRMLAEPVARFNVAATCFLPPPRVSSTVIRLERGTETFSPDLRAHVVRAADAAFTQRRKTIRNSLRAGLGMSDERVDQILAQAGIDAGIRAEELSLASFIDLGYALMDALMGTLPESNRQDPVTISLDSDSRQDPGQTSGQNPRSPKSS